MAKVVEDLLLGTELLHDHTPELDSRYLNESSNLSDLDDVSTARTNLGLVAGGAGDIWVEKAGDTMTGALNIHGSADVSQLVIRAHSSQTDMVTEWQDSSGTVYAFMNPSGVVPQFQVTANNIATSGNNSAIQATHNNKATSPSTAIIRGFGASAVQESDQTLTTMRGFFGGATLNNSGLVTNATGMFSAINFTATGNVTTGRAYQDQVLISSGFTATFSDLTHMDIGNFAISGATLVVSGTHRGLIIRGINKGITANIALETSTGSVVFNEAGDASSDVRMEGDTRSNLFFLDASADFIGIDTATPVSRLDISATTGAVLTLSRNDVSATATDTIGKLQFWNNDTQLTTQNIYADIEVQAFQTVTTDAAAGNMIFRTTGTTTGTSPVERLRLTPTVMVINEDGNDYDVRIEGDTDVNLLFTDASTDRVGIGTNSPGSKLDVAGSFQVDSITNDTGLAHGVYTPTRSAETNLDANVTMTEAQYMRVGNTVTVSGRFTADPTLTATATSFEITLPVASNIGAAEDVAGVAFCGNIAGMGAEIIGVVANDTAKILWVSSDITSQSWSYQFSYQVL